MTRAELENLLFQRLSLPKKWINNLADIIISGEGIESIVAGDGIDIDNADPQSPIISSTVSAGVQSVVAGTGIDVDNTDPENPIVSATGGASYLVYTALLTQASSDPPQVVSNGSGANTPLINTIGTITWEYISGGLYKTAQTFTITKTQVFMSNSNRNVSDSIVYYGVDEYDNKVFIATENLFTYSLSDDILFNNSIEIRVFP